MLYNNSRKKLLAKQIKLCDTLLSKARGLMFSSPIKEKALIFSFKNEQLVPLHMMFVFYPIDVLFLNPEKRVVEIKEKLKPFTYYTPTSKANYVIELPSGTVKSTGTAVGDAIKF